MEKLKVLLFQNEEIIGEARYVDIHHEKKEGFYLIELENLHLLKKQIKKNELFEIQICLSEGQADHNNFILQETIFNSDSIKIKVKEDKTKFNYWSDYSIEMYRILSFWKRGEEINWRNLQTPIGKHAWIRACGRITDFTKQKLTKTEYILDLNEVDDLYDFYCLAGEVFVGEKGYMGGSINAFSDCLYWIKKNSLDQNYKVVFKGFHRIKDRILESEYFLEEMNDYVFKYFEENKFKIVLE